MSSSRQASPAALLIILALACHHSPARADAASGVASCQPAQGALAFLGCSLAQKLGTSARGARVVVVELKSDRELPAPGALRERVQAAVESALGSAGRRTAERQRGELRVELHIEKLGGVLRTTAELRRPTGFWQRLRHREPRAEQHAFAEVALDAELRALIPPPPLVVSETLKIKAPERGIVGLACGPLKADGGQELVLVSRGSVRVGTIAQRTFVERKRATWATLSVVAPAPLREPIASVEITPGGTLRVGLSDRRDGLELSSELAVLGRFEGLLPMPGGGCAPRRELGISSEVGPCAVTTAGGKASATTVDAVTGSARGWLGRELGSARLVGTLPERSPPEAPIGAQLGLGDADSDGLPELLYSSDTLEPAKDRLALVTLQANKAVARFDLPAPAISAVAICSKREGPGMAPIVVAAGDELWLLR